MIKAIIFDLDGLLIDSEITIWPESISEFLQDKGFKYSNDLNEKTRGTGHKETIEIYKKILGLKGNTQRLIAQMRDYFYKNFLRDPQLIKGAKESLRTLSKKGYLLSIATGLGPREKVIELLSSLGIEKYFKEIITGDEVTKGKPDPQIYLVTAEKLDVEPPDCFILEDSVNGVLAGKAAGMRVFGVNKNEKIKKELKKAGADKVFSSLLEIKSL